MYQTKHAMNYYIQSVQTSPTTKSVELSPEDAIIEQIADLLYLLDRKTGIRIRKIN